MSQYGFYINTDICTGCKACMTACFDRNNLTAPEKFRKVFEYGGGDWQMDENGAFVNKSFAYYVSMTCGHCDNPACVANCPTGAMHKDEETGIVSNTPDLCIGCMTCELSCPYGHPVMMEDGLSHKCLLCSDGTEDGKPHPACADACPTRALEFGLMEDLRAKYGDADAIAELDNVTKPNVVFGMHRDADKGGTLKNPMEVTHKDFIH